MEHANVINLYAEIAVFNRIMTDNAAVSRLIGFLFKEKVSTRRHELLRGAIAFLYGVNKPIDLTTLVGYLSEKNLLEAVGGRRYLRFIAEYNPNRN